MAGSCGDRGFIWFGRRTKNDSAVRDGSRLATEAEDLSLDLAAKDRGAAAAAATKEEVTAPSLRGVLPQVHR